MSDLAQQIQDFILDELQPRLALLDISRSSVDEEFDLVSSGALDSMGFIGLVGAVESKFELEINFEDLEPNEFTNLDGFIRCALENK